jgi:hypothetical protein
MTGETPERLERARLLMMAALDGEIGSVERAELDRLLAGDAALNEEWTRMSRVKEVTDTMALKEPPREIWEGYWAQTYNRLERGFAWILVSLGTLVLLAYVLWESLGALLAETEMPGFLKIAIFALLLGGAILLFSVVREKLFTRNRDPYKEIQR